MVDNKTLAFGGHAVAGVGGLAPGHLLPQSAPDGVFPGRGDRVGDMGE